jgi:hypothetical protein
MLRGIGIVWLMGLIVALACVMSYILVTAAKGKSRKGINSVISVYFAFKIHKYRNRKIGIAEEQPRRIPVYNPLEKVHNPPEKVQAIIN